MLVYTQITRHLGSPLEGKDVWVFLDSEKRNIRCALPSQISAKLLIMKDRMTTPLHVAFEV